MAADAWFRYNKFPEYLGDGTIDMDDEIIKGTLVTRDGAVVHPTLAPAAAKPAAEPEAGAGEAPEERKSDGE